MLDVITWASHTFADIACAYADIDKYVPEILTDNWQIWECVNPALESQDKQLLLSNVIIQTQHDFFKAATYRGTNLTHLTKIE